MGILLLVRGWFYGIHFPGPSASLFEIREKTVFIVCSLSTFSETAKPIELKFTILINTTPIKIKFCGKLPLGLAKSWKPNRDDSIYKYIYQKMYSH